LLSPIRQRLVFYKFQKNKNRENATKDFFNEEWVIIPRPIQNESPPSKQLSNKIEDESTNSHKTITMELESRIKIPDEIEMKPRLLKCSTNGKKKGKKREYNKYENFRYQNVYYPEFTKNDYFMMEKYLFQ
jgi:hypothetical protein